MPVVSASTRSAGSALSALGAAAGHVTELFHRTSHRDDFGDAADSESQEELPSSWRQRDRETRRVFRGVCGECGRNVFTDQVQ